MLPATLDEANEPACQFSNAIYLPSADGILRDQFAAYPERDGARNDVLRSSLLVNTAGGNQGKMGKHPVKRANVGVAAKLSAWDDLDEIAASLPRRDNFGRSQGTRKYDHLVELGKFDHLAMQAVAGEKLRARVQTLPRSRLVHHSTGANHHVGIFFSKLRNEFYGSWHGQRDLSDGNPALSDGINSE